jgi:hypothetical protein
MYVTVNFGFMSHERCLGMCGRIWSIVLEGILDATLLSHVMWNSSGEVDLANDLDFEYTSLFHPATLHFNFVPCPAFKRCTTVQPYALSLFVCFYDYLFFSSLS